MDSLCADLHVTKPPSLPVGRWAALVVALILEVLALTVSFDTATLGRWNSRVVGVIDQSSVVGQIAIAAISAMFIFQGQRWRDGVQSLCCIADERRSSSTALIVLVHILSFVTLYQLTSLVFSSEHSGPFGQRGLLLAWMLAAIAWLVSWCAAVSPLRAWRFIVARPLMGAVGLALVAVGIGRTAQSWWRPLADATLGAVSAILSQFYDRLVLDRQARVIGAESFTVQIAPECSGYEGIGLTATFIAVFLWWFRRELRFPHALLILPLGIAMSWWANVLRIAALVTIGASFSQSVAVGSFHSQAGWLLFNAVAFGVVALAWKVRFFRLPQASGEAAEPPARYPAAPLLMPLLAMVAAAMVCAAFNSQSLDLLYPLKVIVAGGTLCYFAAAYSRDRLLQGSFSWAACWIGALVFVTWIALEPLAGVLPSQHVSAAAELHGLGPALATAWIVFRAIGSVVVAPLAEELAFRGYLTRRLIDEDFESVPMGSFSWPSFILSAVLFGGLHGRWMAGTLAGVAFGWALYRRGRLIDAIVAHATANALITGYVIATGDWTAWS
ncbi:MAG: exosortase E/protease, VPEID-CTERM system [Pirellulales bacterium]|nr:exosortase E/protease, VPEID-CTERM system [Pirellulales bacterium]